MVYAYIVEIGVLLFWIIKAFLLDLLNIRNR